MQIDMIIELFKIKNHNLNIRKFIQSSLKCYWIYCKKKLNCYNSALIKRLLFNSEQKNITDNGLTKLSEALNNQTTLCNINLDFSE